jgi:hypothetical protein
VCVVCISKEDLRKDKKSQKKGFRVEAVTAAKSIK